MRVFDAVEMRPDPIVPGETHFNYLQRSDSDNGRLAREVVQQWLNEVHPDHQHRFRKRIRSFEDNEHEAVLFELLVHSFLKGLDFHIVSYEPKIGDRRPDFLAEDAAGRRLIVEASVISRLGVTSEEQEQHQWVAHHALNECPRLPYHLKLRFDGPFQRTPSRSRVRAAFMRWSRASERASVLTIEEAGTTFSIETGPPASEGFSGPTITMVSGYNRSGFVAPQIDLRRKIKRKMQQFAGADVPTVLAVKLLPFWHDSESIISALFGDRQVVIDVASREIVDRSRADVGAFVHRQEPTNTSLSGLLTFSGAEPWCLDRMTVEFWQHPWARRLLAEDMFAVPCWTVNFETGDVMRNP